MQYVSPTPWIDAIVFGLILATFIYVVFYFWIPARAQVFLKQCWRRFITIFTHSTKVEWTTKYPVDTRSVYLYEINIPNALIVGSYTVCCIASVILLP